jgi:predicted ArsR family transcriptional regulator
MRTTVAQLAETEGVPFQSANGFIKVLEKKGLAKRVDKVSINKRGRATIIYEIDSTVKVSLKKPEMTVVVAAKKASEKKQQSKRVTA